MNQPYIITTLILPQLVVDVDLLRRLRRSVQVPIHSRKSRRLAILIHQLHVLESSHPESSDDIILQLRKPHTKTRIPTNTPANITKLLVLVFSTVGEKPLGIERLRVSVDFRVAVNVNDGESGICVRRDDFCAFFVERNGATRDVLAESSAGELQADALPEDEIDHWEFGLPGLRRDLHKAVDERDGRIGAVAVSGGFYLFENPVVPFLVFGQIEQNPGGVDS